MSIESEYYAQLRNDLTRAVQRVCPHWLAGRAEDIVQVSLIRINELQKRNPERSDLNASYLQRVAYTAVVDEIRRLRRQAEVSLEDEKTENADPSLDRNPETRLAGLEVGQKIRECLRVLKRARRLAVTVHLQGHTIAQAARILGWAPKRTENLVYRGLADLRNCLTAKGITA